MYVVCHDRKPEDKDVRALVAVRECYDRACARAARAQQRTGSDAADGLARVGALQMHHRLQTRP